MLRSPGMGVWYRLVLGSLVTWRLTHLLNAEDGPWQVLVKLRRAAGDGMLGQLLDCFYCLSLWVAAPFAYSAAKDAYFSDVPSSAADSPAIDRVYLAGIMHECATSPSLQFCPNNTTIRRGIATSSLRRSRGRSSS